VVSMPCWELFSEQPVPYREDVLPTGCRVRLAIEAASTNSAGIVRLTGNLAFGSLPVGGTASRTLTINNDGASSLMVSSISYPAGFSGSFAGSIAAHGSKTVTVVFAPQAATNYAGLLTVNSNATGGTNTLAVSGSGSANAVSYTYGSGSGQPVLGDFDGDGADDLAVYNGQGLWSIYSIAKDLPLATGAKWGYAGTLGLSGDVDGDGVDDLVVYDPQQALWSVKSLKSDAKLYANVKWGYSGATVKPAIGDIFHEGDGARDDVCVFDSVGGKWYVKSLKFSNTVTVSFGSSGWLGPLIGDYDRDGADDLCAAYPECDRVTGRTTLKWYVWSVKKNAWIANNYPFGGPTTNGLLPLVADFDRCGAADLAYVDSVNWAWNCKSPVTSQAKALGVWGAPGVIPFPGDYYGDRYIDLMVLDKRTWAWSMLLIGPLK